MKDYKTRLKHWLIRKLGGYPTERTTKIVHSYLPMVTVEAFVTEHIDQRFSGWDDRKEILGDVLMKNLANELRPLVQIDCCENPMEGKITYRARIKVADERGR
jgi:hypothetical protein